MGIRVECPNGHSFKVKDKYAGKKGLCPQCDGQVVVVVPDAVSEKALNKAYRNAVMSENRAEHPVDVNTSSVLDDPTGGQEDGPDSGGTSASLIGTAAIRHHVLCPECGQPVPMWYAKCQGCGHFLEHW